MSTNMAPSMSGFIKPSIQQTQAAISTIQDMLVNTPNLEIDPELYEKPDPPYPQPHSRPSPIAPSPVAHNPIAHNPIPEPSTYNDVKSSPSSAALSDSLNNFLDQGILHTAQKPTKSEPFVSKSSVSCPTCPTCPTCPVCPICPVAPSCPPQKQCPDMRDYIRKDKIPCWACDID